MDDAHLGGDSPTVAPTKRALEWSSERRKRYPIFSGLMKYFPDAIYEVARLSLESNEKHNPGEHLHWAIEKSGDTLDCIGRHMLDGEWVHVAWRALENLQRQINAGWEPDWTCPTSKTLESETGSPSQEPHGLECGGRANGSPDCHYESLESIHPLSLSRTHMETQEESTVERPAGPSCPSDT